MVPGRTFLIGGVSCYSGGAGPCKGVALENLTNLIFLYTVYLRNHLFLAAEDITEIPGILRPGISLTLLSQSFGL